MIWNHTWVLVSPVVGEDGWRGQDPFSQMLHKALHSGSRPDIYFKKNRPLCIVLKYMDAWYEFIPGLWASPVVGEAGWRGQDPFSQMLHKALHSGLRPDINFKKNRPLCIVLEYMDAWCEIIPGLWTSLVVDEAGWRGQDPFLQMLHKALHCGSRPDINFKKRCIFLLH